MVTRTGGSGQTQVIKEKGTTHDMTHRQARGSGPAQLSDHTVKSDSHGFRHTHKKARASLPVQFSIPQGRGSGPTQVDLEGHNNRHGRHFRLNSVTNTAELKSDSKDMKHMFNIYLHANETHASKLAVNSNHAHQGTQPQPTCS